MQEADFVDAHGIRHITVNLDDMGGLSAVVGRIGGNIKIDYYFQDQPIKNSTFFYSFTPAGARKFGEALIKIAE
jgi:hypothetical protein